MVFFQKVYNYFFVKLNFYIPLFFLIPERADLKNPFLPQNVKFSYLSTLFGISRFRQRYIVDIRG